MKRKAKINPLAHLTPEEDKLWTFAFEFHVNGGKSDNEADALAWKAVAKQFPRLRKYIGAKP